MDSTSSQNGFELISFDDEFSISQLDAEIRKTEEETSGIMDKVAGIIKRSMGEDEISEVKYVVNFTDEQKTAIENGTLKLVTNSDGECFAQVRNANGQFGDRVSISEDLEKEGVSSEALQMAIQMEAIKDLLNNILDVAKDIEERVGDIHQGQMNDRAGLYYSGLSQFREAQALRDTAFKRQLIAQSLKTLSDAYSQMIQEIRSDIEYLVAGRYKSSGKKMVQKIEEKLETIQSCYKIVFRTSFLKAYIYHSQGETLAMLTTLKEYGRFVDKLIVPYMGKLSELDKHDMFILEGRWGKIASSLQATEEWSKQLSRQNVLFLTKEEKNEC